MPSTKQTVLLETNLPGVKLFSRGKVRDVYELGDKLLVVATDRLSAFDVVMREGIPDKGRVLTQLSCFWFNLIKDEIRHHFITAKVADYPRGVAPLRGPTGRALDARGEGAAFPHRVRGARIPGGVRLERISRHGKRVRHQASRRPAGGFAPRKSHLYACHQGADRPRRKHHLGGYGRAHGKRRLPKSCAN